MPLDAVEVNGSLEESIETAELLSLDDAYVFTHSIFFAYLALICTGLFLNGTVQCSLLKLACKDTTKFRHGSALPLAALSAADLLLLLCVLPVLIPRSLPLNHISIGFLDHLKCKIPVFLMHVLYAFRNFCWLFISIQRYLAVYHPLTAIAKQHISARTLLALLFIPACTDVWLLTSVVSGPLVCEAEPIIVLEQEVSSILHGAELTIFYVVPMLVTLALDVRVIFARINLETTKKRTLRVDHQIQTLERRRRKFGSERIHKCKFSVMDMICFRHQTTESVSSDGRGRHMAMIRWLTITTVIFILNLPENILYFLLLFKLTDETHLRGVHVVARLMYFTQFAFSGAYLSKVIYRRNTHSPPTSDKRLCYQLPILSTNSRTTNFSTSTSDSTAESPTTRNDAIVDFLLGES